MKFLYRMSRFMSVITFVCYVPYFLVLTSVVFREFSSEQLFFLILVYLLMLLGPFVPIIIFNWFAFERLTVWIKKANGSSQDKFSQKP